MELGAYAVYVVSSWVISLGTLGLLVWASMAKSRKVRLALERIEGRRNGH